MRMILDLPLEAGIVFNELNLRLQATKVKVPVQARRSFAIDLAFIANSIRTGYLLDAFSVQDAPSFFSSLLQTLRQRDQKFRKVVHLFEPASSQSFFVNKSRLLETLSTILNHPDRVRTEEYSVSTPKLSWPRTSLGAGTNKQATDGSPVFVRLSSSLESSFEVQHVPSADVLQVLTVLYPRVSAESEDENSFVSITLPELGMETSVPLAAILLEYPVAYIPEASEGSFLCNTTMDVYECNVEFAKSDSRLEEYRLLQFSCPSAASKCLDSLLPSHIQKLLGQRFQPRLDCLTVSCTCRVTHTTTVMDRLAL